MDHEYVPYSGGATDLTTFALLHFCWFSSLFCNYSYSTFAPATVLRYYYGTNFIVSYTVKSVLGAVGF